MSYSDSLLRDIFSTSKRSKAVLNSLLILAVKHENIPGINVLIFLGADKDAKDHNGWTPLAHAAFENKTKAANHLLNLGADPKSRTAMGSTPAILAATAGNAYIIRILRNFGADLNAQDNSGYTALMRAVINRRVQATEMLVKECEVDCSKTNNNGKNAYDLAQEIGDKCVLEIFERKFEKQRRIMQKSMPSLEIIRRQNNPEYKKHKIT